jgi:hypothetical protein
MPSRSPQSGLNPIAIIKNYRIFQEQTVVPLKTLIIGSALLRNFIVHLHYLFIQKMKETAKPTAKEVQ